MLRSISFLAALLLAGITVRAGELDAEYGAKPAATPAAVPRSISPAVTTPPRLLALNRVDGQETWRASELDSESPAQAWGHHGWGGGFGRGFGWGGGFGRGF